MEVYVRKPDLTRKTFSIYQRFTFPNGKTKNITLENKDIEAINFKLKTKKLSIIEAAKLAEGVKARLLNKPPEIHNSQNEKLLEQFLVDYFKENPFLIDKTATRTKYERAVRALGNNSLMNVSADEALAQIQKLKTNSQQREAVSKLNSLFKRLQRQVVVPMPPKEITEIIYITEDELIKLLEAADPVMGAAIALAFYGGLRLGEIRNLSKPMLVGQIINVLTQQDVHDKIRLPKNRKKRKAFLHTKGISHFKTWTSERREYSHADINDYFKALAYEVLGRSDVTFHDLRHSYAIYLLSSGVPTGLLAQSMGNSVKVIEEHYSGFILSDQGIDTISRIMNK